jgi:rfaE bifunctional protein nucleotidyltransferase chain/domain
MNHLDDLRLALRLHKQGKKIVMATGCFDALHLGHMYLLERAKTLGDVLWVGVAKDDAVRLLKGSGRPLYDEQVRKEMLTFLACVTYVTIYDGVTPESFIDSVQPHVYVKGEEYRDMAITERKVVEDYGGKLVFLSKHGEFSTTQLVAKAKESK